ncbi:MAG TPA: S26 family signal peptidase, partial [Vicinamibacterales bacterium]|nr:S26 family signal peptidase [Vicinamibacterales bacterium]
MNRPSLIRRLVFGNDPRRTSVRIVVLATLSFIIFKWVLIPLRAEGISMEPTYQSGSLHLVNRLAYRYRKPARGDIVGIKL